MLEGERVSVGCDMLLPVLLLLPPLQETRPPIISALAKSEHRPVKKGWKGRIE